MPSTKLAADQTATRFGVHKAIEHFPSQLASVEEANVKVVLEYMEARLHPYPELSFQIDKIPIRLRTLRPTTKALPP